MLKCSCSIKGAIKGRIRKGRWGLDESERWWTLRGIRNRIINVVRFGEDLEDVYVRSLNKRLPVESGNGVGW